jgi:hypothetical protein
MRDSTRKVIGYFAHTRWGFVVCDGDSCVIAGSEEAMKTYIRHFSRRDLSRFRIRKTSFGEIATGLRLGAPYSFDQAAFARFLPLAKAAGVPIQHKRQCARKRSGLHLIRLQQIGGAS